MDARTYIAEHRDEFVAALKEWLSIPSVSTSPDHHADVRDSARWLADHLARTGFPTVETWETGGLPAVFAEWPAADPQAPTVLVYGHHDVQPVDPLDAWHTDPFVPVEDGDRLIGRGASDDKGQVLFHTLGVRAGLAASGADAPPVTLKLLVEGEEESGSPHFADLLRKNRARLDCDVVVISDTTMWAADTPSMCVGMRGMTDCDISLYGPEVDLHSGSFGGAVPNPLHAMADLISGLHDADGRVTVPGFYDDVVEIGEEERGLIARLPFDEAEWLRTAASTATAGEAGYSTLERIWVRPTAEVNGMWGGHTGAGRKTIVPRSAHAKVSFRLVPGQEPLRVQDGVRAYVAAHTPPGLRAEVEFSGPGVRACASDLRSDAVRAARSAMSAAFGTEVLYTREGGSGPEADLAEILGAPLVFVAVGLDDDRIHAPNEKVEIPLLLKGAESVAYLWDELGKNTAG
ncbi:acetylornithine deacetylase/succinyl-diaminopimelate desuccinylase-like protein [Nocardiopsis mwathae]|uniref:Acetylornithine deacetylase/succinyl-diaminopimelate desuccinylase-like protein n=1 Tax=Nocardiopsis mwathae TaxID=1472723 RepID=A0A7W9YJJ7_9ACTN|nr:dipeptidase [Nocardiopsis mwathae]MBB6173257.1 acetylornithine deacetylase/succinyl-diaminopimelate desuccinylase-like protein [Nocardiopsis mwathae]